MLVVIQTKANYGQLSEKLLDIIVPEIQRSGYKVKVLNLSNENFSDYGFVANLVNVCRDYSADGCITYFDDLPFLPRTIIPSVTAVNQFHARYPHAQVIRLDGRVPARGSPVGNFDGVRFFEDEGIYMCSTVFTYFSLNFLEYLLQQGYSTAWDIESFREHGFGVYGVRARHLRYVNILVKDQIDLFALRKAGLAEPLLKSVRRGAYRVMVRVIRWILIRIKFYKIRL